MTSTRSSARKKAPATVKRAPLPKLKAKNAYELLGQVCELISEEPLRYNQQLWLMKEKPGLSATGHVFPACGTIGCVAGWVHTLVPPTRETRRRGVDYRAADILGLPWDAQQELFGSGDVAGRPGTRTHARNGVRHIRRFMKKHRGLLESQPIVKRLY
jgi:hypothetical protein